MIEFMYQGRKCRLLNEWYVSRYDGLYVKVEFNRSFPLYKKEILFADSDYLYEVNVCIGGQKQCLI